MLRVLVVLALLLATTLTAQAPLPSRPQLTIENLFEQVGRCNVDLNAERTYQQKLIERIQVLERENAALKESVAKSQ